MNSYPFNFYTDPTTDFTEIGNYTLDLRRSEFKIAYDESKPSFIRYLFNRYYIEHQGMMLLTLTLSHDLNYSFKRLFKDPNQHNDYRLRLSHRHLDSRILQLDLKIFFVTEKLQNLAAYYCNDKMPSLLFSIMHKQSKTPKLKFGFQTIEATNVDSKRPLMSHQKQNLTWMLTREITGYKKQLSKIPNNYTVCNLPYLEDNVVLNWGNRMVAPHSDNWSKSEFSLKGGILADEVGLGKTTSMTALMVANKVPNTIVLCPARLAIQWESEIKTNTDQLRTIVIGSILRFQKFMADPSKLMFALSHSDFLITRVTINILWVKMPPLRKFTWNRLIIDESHEILVSLWSLNATQNRMKTKY